MENKMTNFNSKYAIYFAISCLAFFILWAVSPAWIWVPIPFICTYFVQMLDWM
jgi:hypothetical protein